MSRLLRWIFKPYVEDYVGRYAHSGVGYTGVEFDVWHSEPGRYKHRGVGYTGVYNE